MISSFKDLVELYEYIKIEKENNLILEFANLGPKKHKFNVDLAMHIMQPTDKKLKHGPRVKFFQMKKPTQNFSITIGDEPRVIGDWRKLISQKELTILLENVLKFKIPLLNFWYNPNMLVDDLEEQMEMIRKGETVESTYK